MKVLYLIFFTLMGMTQVLAQSQLKNHANDKPNPSYLTPENVDARFNIEDDRYYFINPHEKIGEISITISRYDVKNNLIVENQTLRPQQLLSFKKIEKVLISTMDSKGFKKVFIMKPQVGKIHILNFNEFEMEYQFEVESSF